MNTNEALLADYSAATSIDELYAGLHSTVIKRLYNENATFKAKVDEFNISEGRAKLIADFRALSDADQQLSYARMTNEQKKIIDDDVDAFTVQQTITLAPSQDEIDAAKKAEQAVAEAAAAGEIPAVQRGTVEILYEGVEKLGEDSYKLTVDPGDGTPAEVFFASTQADLFKALRKSKANATKELRRRAKKIQITDELRALQVEVVNYAPLVQPLRLTPDEIFTFTEQQKDPVTVLEATRKLRQASLTQEECDRMNEAIERQRYSDGYNTAITWIQTHPDFYQCSENIEALQKLMAELNWAVTIKNLDLAYDTLVAQGVLLERPEEPTSNQPVAQPASVVPVVAAPVTQAAASAVTPAATPGALPDAKKVLRPGSSTATLPSRRVDEIRPATAPVLTAEEYYSIPAAVLKRRYDREPTFKAAVDALIASGKV